MLNRLFHGMTTLATVFVLSQAAQAADWTLDEETSHLAYGSIKKNSVGEVNSFTSLSGTLNSEGMLSVSIKLPSLETFIDIRNERMQKFVFQNTSAATLRGQVDMTKVSALPVGGTMLADLEASLSLLGKDIPLETEVFVARLSETQVLAVTNDMLFLSAEDAGLNAGVTKLKELAKLDSITRTVPVTARLVFTASGNQAAAPSAAAETVTEVASAGDASKGKKVFRKCSACHKLEAGKNGAGPSLHGIIGAQSATVQGFNYSKAFQAANLTWTPEALAAFLKDPKRTVPKNRMAFKGLKKDENVQNLIAYLQKETR
jgi:cytochrome c2